MKQLIPVVATTLMASTPALAHDPDAAHYTDGLLHGMIIQTCLLHEYGHIRRDLAGEINQHLMQDVARAERFELMAEMPECPFIN